MSYIVRLFDTVLALDRVCVSVYFYLSVSL